MSVRAGLAICIVLMTLSFAQALDRKAPASPQKDPSFKLVWADEFNYQGGAGPQ
jgi:hypothetical protein